ncbi:putative ubiquitin-conjugating enzyme E2, ubiquitin-conjugating enzyme/RWD [Helianthus annuus]|uniref:Putative ubiquitin-conjugating enzyme 32 n=1 Tax=Helianthus annuus TaxID=4232 RepID=A0A251UQW2_HELAN|nr:ubiquitin-conjugating enzyme E2 32 [Helianthus annuus]KAF5806139.1 putative ubiquitin-conjugating enzyme E2, ubiquitin-conjugating enzyme/RWD [Helianthus annuus]KAJ0577285.1 putative ubiquitin-conjugating enzyme E2, ubiquitin-conjugating enzyme/RWD [Helianthus annuus]KAJ0747368.1 putative ubiquitin-conjugating enzyme E2, ubiquitin-conjugating enzyme/RWD [Helianthus annuus]KAJ0750446.1 putative ubiquitin-conjugating enzyme E2, ubiquitin-conjugating enzyme/RWD [Helianthus annuus]KAJ0789420.1 
MGDKYNMKNPSVKRILQEVKEMQSNPSDDFMSLPLEENIFEWHFAIRGPSDTEFEGGIYHGRIQLPSEYPFKPPSFMLLTPNGRFETQTKICLSISNHHPEHWQPSWSVRTALTALIAFMPTNPNGALGSLDYKKEERRVLAIKSRETAPKFGTPDRQKLIDEIHEYMISKAPPVPQPSSEDASEQPPPAAIDAAAGEQASESPQDTSTGITEHEEQQREENNEVAAEQIAEPVVPNVSRQVANTVPSASSSVHAVEPQQQQVLRVQKPADDRLFTWAAVGLTIAIMVLLLKKFMKASGHGAVFMDES